VADDAAFARFGRALGELQRLRALLPAEAAAFDVIGAALWENRPKNIVSIHEARWMVVRWLLVEGNPYSEVFQLASIFLAGQFGAGAARTVERSYNAVEASLPPEQKHRRTYRRSNTPCPICESRRLMVEYLLRQGVPPPTVFKQASKELAGIISAGTATAIRNSFERKRGVGRESCRAHREKVLEERASALHAHFAEKSGLVEPVSR
jgi:hypothetical protein